MKKERPAAWTIGDLVKRSGEEQRTIRYFIQRGLLSRPVGAGRGAYYTAGHLDEIRRIRDLTRKGVPLAAVRDLLDAERESAARRDLPDPSPWREHRAAFLLPPPDDAPPGALVRRGGEPQRRGGAARRRPIPPAERCVRATLAPGIDLTFPEGALDDDALLRLESLVRRLAAGRGRRDHDDED